MIKGPVGCMIRNRDTCMGGVTFLAWALYGLARDLGIGTAAFDIGGM